MTYSTDIYPGVTVEVATAALDYDQVTALTDDDVAGPATATIIGPGGVLALNEAPMAWEAATGRYVLAWEADVPPGLYWARTRWHGLNGHDSERWQEFRVLAPPAP